jgi:hydroxymethylpyrimidine pyrophosphatase-like HAD family hydrolase/fructoselysine-6-P-deglycase FrlB-like protein
LGKPYWSELELLPKTFAWAKQLDISKFTQSLKVGARFPLISVGSGGSYTAAVLAALFHDRFIRQLALSATPLQAAKIRSIRDCSVLILTAGGKNPDVIGVFRAILSQEPKELAVLCLASSSPVAQLCREYDFVSCYEFDLPSGKDGFVATNSLIAFATILWRAYSQATGNLVEPDLTFEDIVTGGRPIESWCEELRKDAQALWEKPYLMVLHGSSTTHAAVLDLESKFSEAAIGAVQVIDFRNFAHGRHHWLYKRKAETGVLAFITDEDQTLASRTLRLLPDSIAMARISVSGSDGRAALAAMVTSLYLTGLAAEARGIDPGRPGVPEFGRRIYNLNTWSRREVNDIPEPEKIAIERKVRAPLSSLSASELDYWHQAYNRFVAELGSTIFEGLVLDYDGTLCDERFRFETLPKNVAGPLNEILRAGVPLGIATGRGKSVRKALRECLDPSVWPQVIIAYHNGSETGTLDDQAVPIGSKAVGQELEATAKRIELSHVLKSTADLEYRANQISIVPKSSADTQRLYKLVCDLASPDFAAGVFCVRSSHSVDVLAPGVTKRSLLPILAQKIRSRDPTFLCIGDLGSWPGNDFLLLWRPCSLSVNEVSSIPDRCWNIAPRGFRNSQATRYLLQIMTASQGMLQFHTEMLGKTWRQE